MVYKRLVSVIMPVYNSEKLLEKSVISVLSQTYSDLELILIDNMSVDDSLKICRKFAEQDSRVKVISCERKGAAEARNTGIKIAQGSYIAFLDSDDLWSHNKLNHHVKFMIERNLAFSWTGFFIRSNKECYLNRHSLFSNISMEEFVSKRKIIGCLTVMYDVEQLGKVFMPCLKMRNDYATWFSIIRECQAKKLPFSGLEIGLSVLNIHNESLTSNKFLAAYYQWVFLSKICGFGLIKKSHYFALYILRALIR